MIATEELVMRQEQLEFCTDSPFTAQYDFSPLNTHFETRSLDDLLEWALATFGRKVAQVTSFGPTGMVILDRLAKLAPGIRIITLDTNFLFDETYALMEQVQQRYSIELDIRRSPLTPEAQATAYGPALWESAPDHCCHLRKVVPLGEVMGELDAWITGLRRDQSPTRTQMPLVTWDHKYDLVKLNPLAGWTRGQIWSYILEHNVPYNPLHDQGFASIGCTYCTHPTTNTADERSGRWKGRTKTECGIHLA